MERYFSTTNKSVLRAAKTDIKKRFQPYDESLGRKGKQLDTAEETLSSSEITKLLLKTLSDESNPITHSDIGERSGHHVTSVATGHQVSEGRGNRRLYLQHREQKLGVQRDASESAINEPQVLRNVRVYINGFLNETTDIEMKRIVIAAGGQALPTPSDATHILTSMQLSASKTHKILNAKSRHSVHVVKPEWIFDSIKAGKRLSEREYAIIKNTGSKNLVDMWQK